MPSKESMEIAAQCWCDNETQTKEIDSELATAFAKKLDEKQALIDEIKDFAIWMTGCQYHFEQHQYFIQQRDKLLKN